MPTDTPERIEQAGGGLGAARFIRPLIYAGIVAVVALWLVPQAFTDADREAERNAAQAIAESPRSHPEVWSGWALSVEPIEAPGPAVRLVISPFGTSGAEPPTREQLAAALAEATKHASVRVVIRLNGSESALTLPWDGAN
jgi:hypothetical protein